MQTMTGRILAVVVLAAVLAGTSQAQDPKPAGAPAERDLLAEVKQRQKVCEQQAAVRVATAEKQAARWMASNPRKARQLLHAALDDIKNDPDLSDLYRSTLQERLERDLKRWFDGRIK